MTLWYPGNFPLVPVHDEMTVLLLISMLCSNVGLSIFDRPIHKNAETPDIDRRFVQQLGYLFRIPRTQKL